MDRYRIVSSCIITTKKLVFCDITLGVVVSCMHVDLEAAFDPTLLDKKQPLHLTEICEIVFD